MEARQKLPQRILGTIADNLGAGRPSPGLVLAVAAWMRYVGGTDERGQPIEVKDPLAERLRDLSGSAPTPEEKVAALLTVREIFSPGLAAQLADPVGRSYALLCRLGARQAVEEIL